jgi:uncharacterized protein YkwD
MKIYRIITIILIILAFGAGFYFKDDVIQFYNNFNKQVQDFQKTDLGQTMTKASKEILQPTPLSIGGIDNHVVLSQTKIITETNLQRQENGSLPALKENTKLNEAASAKAGDILKNQYFEHVSPSGVGPGKLVQNYGYDFIVAGENLILGNFKDEKEVVQDWMNSPGHRANILNNRYTEIGVAVVKGTYKGNTVWVGVQEFGLPLSSCSEPDINVKNEIDKDKSQLDVLTTQINTKKTQLNNAEISSPIYRQMVEDYNQLVSQYNTLADQAKKTIADYNVQVNIFNTCVAGK